MVVVGLVWVNLSSDSRLVYLNLGATTGNAGTAAHMGSSRMDGDDDTTQNSNQRDAMNRHDHPTMYHQYS